jgi:hypothetical protein
VASSIPTAKDLLEETVAVDSKVSADSISMGVTASLALQPRLTIPADGHLKANRGTHLALAVMVEWDLGRRDKGKARELTVSLLNLDRSSNPCKTSGS